MEAVIMEKLKILAESAKFDVSCSSSGSNRQNDGRIGNAHVSGICHSWGSDGRCISLLKILFTNRCEFDCEYCVNRRSNDVPRASFEPDELARLTIEFYRRNYIEGLFVSSAVERSPDHTAERMLECIRLLRHKYGFSGYIHAKMIPGASPEMIHMTGLEADRVSVNIEMPDSVSLSRFAPQKKPKAIFAPMRKITNSLIERNALVGPGNMFRGQEINSAEHYLTGRTKNVQKTPQGIYIPDGRGTGRSSYPAGAVQDRQCHSRKMASGAYCGGNSPAEGPGSAVDANCGGNDSAGSRRIADKSGASGSPGYFSGADRHSKTGVWTDPVGASGYHPGKGSAGGPGDAAVSGREADVGFAEFSDPASRVSEKLTVGSTGDSLGTGRDFGGDIFVPSAASLPEKRRRGKDFAPAGQTTQMIIGAGGDTDQSILTTSENLYRTFKMKRVYYSAYVPVVDSPVLPDRRTAPPLAREHRIYQADWLLRFYGFTVGELFGKGDRNLDPDLDPKVTWALRNLEQFPVEVNKASWEMLMRIPGIGAVSARRIMRQRRVAAVRFDDLKKMGVVMKRAKYFLTCCGRYYGERRFEPETIRNSLLQMEDGLQVSMFDSNWRRIEEGERQEKLSAAGII